MMEIKGLQKLSLLDFPGRIAATVFLFGCNFRCPFCHNASLVVKPSKDFIEEEEFFRFLESRRGKLSGVCISGGEPTLYPELPAFIKKIKDMGFAVKLDTNGTNPALLKALVCDGLVDYVAMDIKNSKERYGETVGIDNFDISPIEESVEFLLCGAVDYEFRTTLVKEFHSEADMRAIGEWISGAKRYFLQTFEDSGDLIGEGLTAPLENEKKALKNLAKSYVSATEIRS